MIAHSLEMSKTLERIQRVRDSLTPEQVDPIVERVAFQTLNSIVRATPKRWTGQTRAAWQVQRNRPGEYVVYNDSPIMRYLEYGTGPWIYPKQVQGPLQPGQRRRRRALFVPKTKKAAFANRRFYGTGTVVRKGQTYQATFTPGGKRGTTLIYGIDYVLAARVRGIKAMHIVADQAKKSEELLKSELKTHLRKAING